MQEFHIVPQELTADAFRPFGAVLANDGTEGRSYISSAVERTLSDAYTRLWIGYVLPLKEPFRVRTLERHVRSAQTFIPLSVGRWIIVVAPTAQDGGPDVAGIKAFYAKPGQGITYRMGTWHHGSAVFGQPATFAILMWRTDENDDEVRPIAENVVVDL